MKKREFLTSFPAVRRPFVPRSSRRVLLAALLAVALLSLWMVFWPVRPERQAEGVCRVEAVAHYEVPVSTGDTLRFSLRGMRLCGVSGEPLPVDTLQATGTFLSLDGEVLTSSAVVAFAPDSIRADSLRALLEVERERVERLLVELREQHAELNYYERTHSVVDDGYNEVMAYRAETMRRIARLERTLSVMRSALAGRLMPARLQARYFVSYAAPGEQARRYAAEAVSRKDSLMLLQLSHRATPFRAYRFAVYAAAASRRATAFLLAGNGRHVLPLSCDSIEEMGGLLAEGTPAVNRYGQLCAVRAGRRWVSAEELYRLATLRRGFIARTWITVKLGVSKWFSDADTASHGTASAQPGVEADAGVRAWRDGGNIYFGQTLGGRPQGWGRMRYANGAEYEGHWRRGMRDGTGEYTDSTGFRYAGKWCADTLPHGSIQKVDTCYRGRLNRNLKPEGNGRYTAPGEYYNGLFRDGRRNGFGFSVQRGLPIHIGEWRKGKFRGEQMLFTDHRVLGIDISRYQHEIGKRIYPIDWSCLRVTNLGHSGSKKRRVRGVQDYPVSYVYIKASEGVSITNRYYRKDAASARVRNLSVGAYHFFSTESDGEEQAHHFMKTAAPRRGDMPPMLDIEPTDGKIKAMGGATALWRETLKWLHVVEEACGVRPVLYVSQSFVDKYMSDAPPAIAAYPVWIARYSEYRPYVRLLYWQLSPDGAVRGIKGDVDINVFNGTREQFDEYRRKNAVK